MRRVIKKIFKNGKKISSHGSLHLDVLLGKDGRHYIAHCLDLDIVAQGATVSQVKANLIDLINDQIEFAVDNDLEELIVHPAPAEYWRKFYEIKASTLRHNLVEHPPASKKQIFQTLDIAYA